MRKKKKKANRSRIAELLSTIGNEQIAVAQLEAIGLPLRIINLLEDYVGVIWLEELLQYTPDQLRERVPNLGDKSMRIILDCLARLEELLESQSNAGQEWLHRAPSVRTDVSMEPPVAPPTVCNL